MEIELFEVALDALAEEYDLVNQVLEVTLDNADSLDLLIVRYALPVE